MGLLPNLLAVFLCTLGVNSLPLAPTDNDCVLASPTTPNPFPAKCGRYNISRATGNPRKSSRIVGGNDAILGQFPWQAKLPTCGASIIDERHLVTAAHCVDDWLIGQSVFAGGVNASFPQSECTTQERKIIRIQSHPCYCGKGAFNKAQCGPSAYKIPASMMARWNYDVAVITIDKPFHFNEFVQPVCLAKMGEHTLAGTMAVASGFGRLIHGGPVPESLQYVWLPVVSPTECKILNGNSKVTDDMLCAGFSQGGKGTCQGDSGGPLVKYDEETDDAVLIGIVSWGYGCGEPNHPGVFANVAKIVDWIQEAVENNRTLGHEYYGPTNKLFENPQCYDYYLNRSLINATSIPPTASPYAPPPSQEDCQLASPSTPNPYPGQCGKFNVGNATKSFQSYIVGGQPANRGQFPWHAMFGECGASIIDERHLLTAAQCLHGTIPEFVIAGGIYRSTPDECTTQKRRVVHFQSHPCYCGSTAHYYQICGPKADSVPASTAEVYQYDIAVITIDEPFHFNEFVQPVCLPEINEDTMAGTMVVASGYGSLFYNGYRPDSLHYVSLPIVPQTECTTGYSNNIAPDVVLCAGSQEDGKSICQGDAGGPLVKYDKNMDKATLIGVISQDYTCAVPGWAGVFANTAKLVDWIQEAVDKSYKLVNHELDILLSFQFKNQECYDFLLKNSLINATSAPPFLANATTSMNAAMTTITELTATATTTLRTTPTTTTNSTTAVITTSTDSFNSTSPAISSASCSRSSSLLNIFLQFVFTIKAVMYLFPPLKYVFCQQL